MLGKYERLDVLGHGASGIVYLAKDTLLGKQVALKEITAQGEEKHRFLEEARVSGPPAPPQYRPGQQRGRDRRQGRH